MPTCGVTAAKLGQKNSGKKPSAGEEQAKEAALMEAIKAAHEKVNDAKAGKKGEKKEATRKAKADVKKFKEKAAERKPALRKETTEEAPLKKKATRKGPLQIQEGRPPDLVCQQDLEIRPTTKLIEEPPHGRNDDLR